MDSLGPGIWTVHSRSELSPWCLITPALPSFSLPSMPSKPIHLKVLYFPELALHFLLLRSFLCKCCFRYRNLFSYFLAWLIPRLFGDHLDATSCGNFPDPLVPALSILPPGSQNSLYLPIIKLITHYLFPDSNVWLLNQEASSRDCLCAVQVFSRPLAQGWMFPCWLY